MDTDFCENHSVQPPQPQENVPIDKAIDVAFEHHKARRFAAALGVQAGYLTWIALGFIVDLHHAQFYLAFWGALLHLIAVVGFVGLILQPGLPPALLLILRHAYSLLLCILSLPSMIKAFNYVSRAAVVNVAITAAIAVASIVFLARALKPEK